MGTLGKVIQEKLSGTYVDKSKKEKRGVVPRVSSGISLSSEPSPSIPLASQYLALFEKSAVSTMDLRFVEGACSRVADALGGYTSAPPMDGSGGLVAWWWSGAQRGGGERG